MLPELVKFNFCMNLKVESTTLCDIFASVSRLLKEIELVKTLNGCILLLS